MWVRKSLRLHHDRYDRICISDHCDANRISFLSYRIEAAGLVHDVLVLLKLLDVKLAPPPPRPRYVDDREIPITRKAAAHMKTKRTTVSQSLPRSWRNSLGKSFICKDTEAQRERKRAQRDVIIITLDWISMHSNFFSAIWRSFRGRTNGQTCNQSIRFIARI